MSDDSSHTGEASGRGKKKPMESRLVPPNLKTFEIAAKLNSGGANCNVPIEKEIF
jgi:hypothetical protein